MTELTATNPAVQFREIPMGPSFPATSQRLPSNLLGRYPSSSLLVYAAGLSTGLFLIFQGLHGEIGEGDKLEFWPAMLLAAALTIALSFEFVNGFHDTANAAATVIYSRSLPPNIAVAWSGLWNFIGILFSTGAVAFGVVSLLPVELILRTGESAGFAMVLALLFAAIGWNLGTWYIGLPVSSSHALIGAIMGVGFSNQWLAQDGQWGVDWSQLQAAGLSLLISPFMGFCGAALLLVLVRRVIRSSDFCRSRQVSHLHHGSGHF